MGFLVWQLIDSGFPAGGFAHSGGLEACVAHGRVPGGSVLAFARQSLSQAGRSTLPIVTAAHREPHTLADLDRLSDAFLSSTVANRASRAQGRAFLTSVTRSFPHQGLAPVEECVQLGRLCAHYAPLLGVVCRTLGIDLPETQRAFLFMTVRGVSSAAVRLGLIGAYEAQELQTLLGPDIEQTRDRCGALAAADIAQTAPLIDLCQSTHDRLYSRLFQS